MSDSRALSRAAAGLFVPCVVLALAGPVRAQASTRVLVIGDSQLVETAGEVLDGLLRLTPGLEVTTRAVWGTHPGDWTRGRDLPRRRFFARDPEGPAARGTGTRLEAFADLARRATPELVVVALGANTFGVSSSRRRALAAALLDAVEGAGAACVWVGPPSAWGRDPALFSEMYDDLTAVLAGRCALVDSRTLLDYPREWGGDGVHLETASRMRPSGRARALCEAEAERARHGAPEAGAMPSADDVCASGADLARTWATAVYREVMRAYRRARREPGLAAP